ncbi:MULTISPECIES: glutamine synthetase family protein [Herpetosiphon]|uniref:Glutamine synthetase n=1 Tax=Herpetosiphon geysericola TaxID=70996 RepID=A0A0N8GR27_9CHLR|nr:MULTISPECIES: glutamine synthetase family protein [Herpetosiphon]KPL85330.1 glutamine synthetase [Herpetosiphon geysericola]
MPVTKEEILEKIAEQRVQFINLQFTDIVGIIKNVTIPVSQIHQALDHGVWFDGSSIEGFARIAESDMYLVPDLNTYAVIPWESTGDYITARFICDVFTPDDQPFAGDPRHVLKRTLAQAAELGFIYNTGPELEFFLFKPGPNGELVPIPHDAAGYFDVSTDYATHIRRQMVASLQTFGIKVEASHHEVAIGQHEIDFEYGDALTMADHTVTFRTVLKAIAQLNGLHATFMPKPIAGINGSGMHVHQSLSSIVTGRNEFHDHETNNLSLLAQHFTAGLLDHALGMTAVLAPLVNSYKRLVPGYEAPIYVSWGRTNRSALVRIPRISAGRSNQATRIELRCPDPSANPYLAFSVMLAAGLDGIKRKLMPPPSAEEDLYHVDPIARGLKTLPVSLGEALEELKRDSVIQEALGEHIYERYIEAKTQEWDAYRRHVSQWELDRYLPIY